MKPRIIAFLLIFVLSACLFSACGAEKVDISCPVHVEGAIFGGQAGDSIPTELSFNAKWLTKGDNTRYNEDLAAFSALISADVYFRDKDLERGSQNRVLLDDAEGEYDRTMLLKAAGFTDVEYIESYKAKEYTADTNDSVTMTLGYQCAGNKYDLYVVALRGCFSAQEWMSVFDPGYAGESYTAYTGEHTEWVNAGHYKGADVAAARAMEFIEEFVSEHDDPEKGNCMLITGHSRGGMLADMIGAAFEKKTDVKAFTYTFNTMPVTTDAEAPSYQTIFNIFDSDDFYCNALPFAEETFYRYGKNVSLTISGSDEVKEALAALKGRGDYASLGKDALEEYRELFGARFQARASLYDPETLHETFASEEEAESRLEECRTLIGAEAGLALEPFAEVGEVSRTADGEYAVKIDYCGGALLWGYCKILAYGSAAYDAFVSLFRGDEAACRIADFLNDHASEITGGHQLANSYVLTHFVG
ncbi:MAG: hypothetical protein MJ141_00795 [Clostridia bacterium]|nr:hypothetical protein [Clostridia bacterium]